MDNEDNEVFELVISKPVLWLVHSVMEKMSGGPVSAMELDEMLGSVLDQEGIEILDNATKH